MMNLLHTYTLMAGLLAAAPPKGECLMPPSAEVSQLKKAAEAANKAGRLVDSAVLWRQVAGRYQTCNFRQRPDAVIRVLNILKTLPSPSMKTCDDPALQAARLVRQTHEDLLKITQGGADLAERKKLFSDRLARLPPTALEAARFLDGPPLPAAQIVARHAQALQGFGACPELRSALARHVSTAIPPELPAPPGCDSESEQARELLRSSIAALESAEPGTAAGTSEHKALTNRLAMLEGLGAKLIAIRARATAETDVDRAAGAWAELTAQIPACPAYLVAKQEAATTAVMSWQRAGEHRTPAAERYHLSSTLLDAALGDISARNGPQASKLEEFATLSRLRDDLKPPTTEPPRKTDPIATSVPKPDASPKPTPWIHRYQPERNMVEIGVIAGIMAPSSGLFAQNSAGTHQLFDPYKQRQSLNDVSDNVPGAEPFYKPYRKVAPEFGLRLAWYPLAFLGGEIEGGVMPTRTVPPDGSSGARATLFHARAHLVGQLPWWRVTPFILIGGGALGTRGALGSDTDPTFNFGVGVKFYASRYTMVRLDLRDSIGDSFVFGAGGTHYPELLVGLSFTLNRRREGASNSSPAPGKSRKK